MSGLPQAIWEVVMAVRKILVGVSIMLMPAGAMLAQEAGNKSINTAGEKGAYHALFCPPLPAVLANAYFQGYKCTPSEGSIENINRVLNNPTSIGFVQFDVYASEAVKRAEELERLTVIRTDIACEGLWMVTKNPALGNYGHVLAFSRRIPFILPPPGSGAAASFAFLQANDPEGLGRVPEANKRYVADATAVLNETASSTDGAVGFFVQFADPSNANIKLIVEKALTVIPVASREILRLRLGGQTVYQLQLFNLKAAGIFVEPREVTTACTPVAIITAAPSVFGSDRDKADDQRDLIQKVREVPAENLLPQESRIASIIRYAKRLSQETTEEVIAAVEKTRQVFEDRGQ
jgi:hypothetical protein